MCNIIKAPFYSYFECWICETQGLEFEQTFGIKTFPSLWTMVWPVVYGWLVELVELVGGGGGKHQFIIIWLFLIVRAKVLKQDYYVSLPLLLQKRVRPNQYKQG